MILSPTTELDAVNVCLKAIGETPIDTLVNIGLTDAAIARDLLAEVTREVLSLGWYFNSDEAFVFALDTDNKAAVPPNVMSLRPSKADARRLVPRGGFLYDMDAKTNVFDPASPPTLDVRWLFDFETLPETARRYITLRAARLFQDRVQGSDSIHSFTERDETQAQRALRMEDDAFNPANVSTDTQDQLDIWSR